MNSKLFYFIKLTTKGLSFLATKVFIKSLNQYNLHLLQIDNNKNSYFYTTKFLFFNFDLLKRFNTV